MTKFLTGNGSNLSFLEPVFLYLLIPLAILFILWSVIALIKIKTRPSPTYGSRYPLIGRVKFWGLFVIPAGVFMVLALAKPYFPKDGISFSRGDVEVILVVDRSISMRGDDVRESRLEIAKREALNIESLLKDNDKIALFVFGRESHRKIYLTTKHPLVFERVSHISFPEVGNLSGDGLIWDSDFSSMLENIYQSMDRQDAHNDGYLGKKYTPKKRFNRIIILISDGEDQFRRDRPTDPEGIQSRTNYLKRLDRSLSELRHRGIKIYPVGIGTTKGVTWPSLLKGYKKTEDYSEWLMNDWQGKVSRLDKDNLAFLARSSGAELNGYIWTVENSPTTVRSYLRSVIDSNRSVLPQFSTNDVENPLWQYFLLATVVILSIGILSHPIMGYLRKNKGA